MEILKIINKIINHFGEAYESTMPFLIMVLATFFIIIYTLNLSIDIKFKIFIVVFMSFSFACYGLCKCGMFNALANGDEKKKK